MDRNVIVFGGILTHHGHPLYLGDFILADQKGRELHLVGQYSLLTAGRLTQIARVKRWSARMSLAQNL